MKKIIILLSFVGLLIGCQESIVLEDAKTLTDPALKGAAVELVVPSDLYPSIQAAVDASTGGETILIGPGVYKELVKVYFKNDLSLIGDNAVLSPTDEVVHGDGYFNIEILESNNISVMNMKFDGQPEDLEYPVYCAIAFTHSSGEASHNKIDGYSQAIVSYNPNPGEDPLNLKINKNIVRDCYGGFELQGNYDVLVEQNNISFNFDHPRDFDHFFPFWHGILMEGGTGTISKNKIKFKGGSDFLISSVGVHLMKRDPAPHMAGEMMDMHDVEVSHCIINGTDAGIIVNSDVPLYNELGVELDEPWCILGLSLLHNTFVQVADQYLIYNECEEVMVLSEDL